MALSFIVLTANAGQGPYNVAGLDYDDQAALAVQVDGAPATFELDDHTKRLTILTPTVTSGAEIRVIRTTDRTEAGLPVTFIAEDVIDRADLDSTHRRIMLIAQEAQEQTREDIDLQGIFRKPNGQWGAENLRLEDIADGVFNEDAATINQLQIADAGARLLPPVDSGDNDSGLFVVAGEWAVRDPAQSRTHLGLGTVALATAGTGASQVPQLNGSAQFPANDGQLIDLTLHPLTALVETRELAVMLGLRSINPISILAATANPTTWVELSGTRIGFGAGAFTQTFVNAPLSEINPNPTSPNSGILLAQGLWRIKWSLSAEHQGVSSTMPLMGFAFTTAENSSAVTSLHRPFNQRALEFVAGALNKPASFSGELIVSNPSASQRTLAVRRNSTSTSQANMLFLTIVIQKIQDTPDATFPELTS